MISELFLLTDVWLKQKGIQKEDQPVPQNESLELLQLECFAKFGRKNSDLQSWDIT